MKIEITTNCSERELLAIGESMRPADVGVRAKAAAPAPEGTPAPGPENSGANKSQTLAADVTLIAQFIESGDAASLAERVWARGLIVGRYATGAPNRGLTNDAAKGALEALLAGAAPRVVAYSAREPGRVDLVITGFNAVLVTPATGEALMVSDPAQVSLFRDNEGNWLIGMVAIDDTGLLRERLSRPPIQSWPTREVW